MKIAIHCNDWSFSRRWVDYCKSNNIEYKIVDCYRSDIIQLLADCDVLLWHHHHAYSKDKLFAKQLLFALEHSGIKVFPDFRTGWHFDDKVGQKYLLESIKAPLVPSYVFYSKQDALKWAAGTSFPKVFKLRTGAGSYSVYLVRNRRKAKRMIRRSFGRGFSPYNKWNNLKDTWMYFRAGKAPFFNVLKSLGRVFYSTRYARIHGNQKGYAYFQDFIPGNSYDSRVIVIGDRAFAIKRIVRKNDFRASASGNIIYDKDQIDKRLIKLSFEINEKLNTQCIAFDYIFDKLKNPLITEINYGFDQNGYLPCPGYWDKNLNWHEESFHPEDWILGAIINK